MPVDPGFYERGYSLRDRASTERAARWRARSAEQKAQNVLARVPELRGRPARLLDVGCGDGALIAELVAREPAWSAAGVEIAEAPVAIAAQRLPAADIRLYDGARLPFEDDAFELGVLSHVLEHVDDPVGVLRETARACRVVVVEVPLEQNLSARRASRHAGQAEVGHVQSFSREGVDALVARAGLRAAHRATDPLGRWTQTYFATSAGERAAGTLKWLVRAGLHRAAPGVAPALFTTHYACRCDPQAAGTAAPSASGGRERADARL